MLQHLANSLNHAIPPFHVIHCSCSDPEVGWRTVVGYWHCYFCFLLVSLIRTGTSQLLIHTGNSGKAFFQTMSTRRPNGLCFLYSKNRSHMPRNIALVLEKQCGYTWTQAAGMLSERACVYIVSTSMRQIPGFKIGSSREAKTRIKKYWIAYAETLRVHLVFYCQADDAARLESMVISKARRSQGNPIRGREWFRSYGDLADHLTSVMRHVELPASPPPRRSHRASVAPPRIRVGSLGRTYADDHLGRHVRRRFCQHDYRGLVIGKTHINGFPYWRVLYEDQDEEDLNETELVASLMAES